MDISIVKQIQVILSFVKEGSTLVRSVISQLDGKRRDDAIRNLRLLHFGPSGLLRWTDKVIAKDGFIDIRDIEELSMVLKSTTEPVSRAVDQLSEFVFDYVDLPFEEFQNILTFLDGKSTVREKLQKIINRYSLSDADQPVRLNSGQITEIRASIMKINAEISSIHDSLVVSRKK